MAGVVNIRRDVDDKFYRYRMPILLTKIEGKGNGIKTVIPNMSDVARALSRPPTYPTKFFGCELGAQTSFDEKNDRYIVNGAHDAVKLRELLDAFIDKFVLCRSCKNPETDLIITKNEEIIRDCKACGERTGVDMRHKLTTFIVKNPPKTMKKSKSSRKGTADGSPSPGANGNENGDAGGDAGAESDDELTRRIKAEAAELNPDAVAITKDDWSVDTSAEAVKARVKAVESRMAAISLSAGGDDDSDEDADSPYSQLGRWIEDNRDIGPVEVYKKAEELGIAKKHKAVQVLAQALFSTDVLAEIPKYAPLFAKMVTSEKHQKSLLGGIERLVGVVHPELVPAVPKILMEFYQADILEEEVVKQWGTHVSKKYVDKEISKKVRKASEPFLKWLDEAEDSEDDDDDE
ncbi:eukaryotic translation initiation factor 5 [Wolfiporia cocos MD-104 SS10]|uniref:Eukaryotic translation initiation factor 5 n=1 Tax=Wolfiporia cocos (strain MD-104) TaxID=742152 RepID=A0A2H3JAZ5_WOLCO|nr:eukaryotic translation initiation factor 5 [Wolfiporia cocos MD-104 SS10]